MDTDSASDSVFVPDMSDKCEEGELSDLDPDNSFSDVDQAQSEEQTYRETAGYQSLYELESHPRYGYNPGQFRGQSLCSPQATAGWEDQCSTTNRRLALSQNGQTQFDCNTSISC